MKTFEIFKNGTQQGTINAKNKKEAQKIVFATYGEDRDLHEVLNEECDHDFIPVNNDGKHKCRFCGEIED